MLVALFGFLEAHIWHYSIRVLGFVNALLVCFIVISIHDLSEVAKKRVVNILKGAFAYAFALWFFCGFLHRTMPAAPYNCTRVDWMLVSASTLVMALVQSYVTLTIIQSIQNYTNSEGGYVEEGIQNYSKDDGNNRKVQLTGLMIGFLLPALLQFAWDYLAHEHADSPISCSSYFYSSSLFTLITLIVAKTIAFFIPPWMIFFVFYWKNRKYINTVQDNPDAQLFFDRRSELLEKVSF